MAQGRMIERGTHQSLMAKQGHYAELVRSQEKEAVVAWQPPSLLWPGSGGASANPHQGFDTRIQAQGINISQGQRQLLVFARVIAQDPEILILDEATASIDTNTEAAIQKALTQITAQRTTLIIAHRLQTIRDADRIIVLKHGTLVEAGRHEELLALNGDYAGLYAAQFKDS